MGDLRQLSHFILYTHLWVAGCAAAQVMYTLDIIADFPLPGNYVLFVFGATLLLYCAHRLIGFRGLSVREMRQKEQVAYGFKTHIALYTALGLGIAVYALWKVNNTQLYWLLMPPAIIAFSYILPVFGSGRRLRDFHWVKIFMIAAVWSYVVVIVPLLMEGIEQPAFFALAGLERAFLFIAVTIPSDIRDKKADESIKLKTFATTLGVLKSKWLALGFLLFSAVLTFILIAFGFYPLTLLLPYILFLIIAGFLIYAVRESFDDLYFSGLIDGCVFLLPLLFWAFHS